MASTTDPAKRWADLVRRGRAAADKEDWDAAVRHLRKALEIAGDQVAVDLRRNLAVCLANRAVATVEQQRPGRAGEEQMLERIPGGSGRRCAVCTKPAAYRAAPSSATPGAEVCEEHAEALAAVTGVATPQSKRAALERAEADLSEALRLDARLEGARQSLRDVRGALRQLKGRGRSRQALATGLVRLLGFALAIAVVTLLAALLGGLIAPWERVTPSLLIRWAQGAMWLTVATLLWLTAGPVSLLRAVLVTGVVGLVLAAIGGLIGPWASEAGFFLRWGQAMLGQLWIWMLYKMQS